MTEREAGRFTIATRVYLSAAQRERLHLLVLQEGVDLPELLSELLGRYLDELPAPPPPTPEQPPDVSGELAQRRAELRRVRAQQRAAGSNAPSWLVSYIAELEEEIARLEKMDDGQ